MGFFKQPRGRVCFWTTAVQNIMILQWADYYKISRSAATAMIVRKALDQEMASTSELGRRLKAAYAVAMGGGGMRAASELADEAVHKGMDELSADEVPW